MRRLVAVGAGGILLLLGLVIGVPLLVVAALLGSAQSAVGCSVSGGQLGSSQVADAEAKLGRPLLYSREYVRTWGAPVTVTPGHIPVLSINTVGTTWAAVASGAQDAVIRQQARQVTAIPGTVYLAFQHEPEHAPAGTPVQFTAAWRHYVAVYRAAGVRNVRWTLILMADSFNGIGRTADAYYPGDDVVDVVAADGYNWQGVRPGAGRSFAQVFTGFYDWGAAQDKPMIIAEFGMAALPGRPQWITDAAVTARSWPQLQVVMWWNSKEFTIGPDAVPALQAFSTPTAAAASAGGARAADQLSWDQVKGHAAAAGFTGPDLDIATALTEPESGRNPLARNSIGASGLWQILQSAHPDLFARYDWRDPAQNAVMAFAVYVNAGRSFTPWVTYTSGAYLPYMAEVAAAAPAARADVTAGCIPPAGGGNATPGVATAAIPCAAGIDKGVAQAPGGVAIRLCTLGGITVNTTLSRPLGQLLDAAAAAGLRLGGGGFRSQAEQIVLRRAHCPDVWTSPPSSCHPPTAIPGKSQHEWGLAIDFTNGGHTIGSHTDPTWQWLSAHAGSYGLRNLPSEPWHWSTTGA
jgi:Lysozyme like domain/D-alanyl-D-alanine carboxypeptidase